MIKYVDEVVHAEWNDENTATIRFLGNADFFDSAAKMYVDSGEVPADKFDFNSDEFVDIEFYLDADFKAGTVRLEALTNQNYEYDCIGQEIDIPDNEASDWLEFAKACMCLQTKVNGGPVSVRIIRKALRNADIPTPTSEFDAKAFRKMVSEMRVREPGRDLRRAIWYAFCADQIRKSE